MLLCIKPIWTIEHQDNQCTFAALNGKQCGKTDRPASSNILEVAIGLLAMTWFK